MKPWIEHLEPIINEYNYGNETEPTDENDIVPLNSGEVDDLCRIIRAKINLHQGNITESEYNEILG